MSSPASVYYKSLSEHFKDETSHPGLDCEDCSWFLEVNGTKILLDADQEVRDIKIGKLKVEECL